MPSGWWKKSAPSRRAVKCGCACGRGFHWAMTAFWGIIALIHWFDPRGHFHSGLGEAVTSVPFLLFLVVGLLREKSVAVRATRG